MICFFRQTQGYWRLETACNNMQHQNSTVAAADPLQRLLLVGSFSVSRRFELSAGIEKISCETLKLWEQSLTSVLAAWRLA